MKEKIKLFIELNRNPKAIWDIDNFDAIKIIIYSDYRKENRVKRFYIKNNKHFRVPVWRYFL